MTIVWTEHSRPNSPGWERGEFSYTVGCCSYSSHKSGHHTRAVLVCDNKDRHWEKSFPRDPGRAVIERLVAEHMAECPYQKADD